jgi:hypothetical protein
MGNEQPLVRLFSESRPTPYSLIVLENRRALATKEELRQHTFANLAFLCLKLPSVSMLVRIPSIKRTICARNFSLLLDGPRREKH